MNDTRSHMIMALFVLIASLVFSWGYMAMVDGGARQFWGTFGVLIVARLVFGVIEALGSVVSWRLHGKDLMANRILLFLRANGFPKRAYAHDDFLTYLDRIGDGVQYSASIKASAKEIRFLLSTFKTIGVIFGTRMHSAAELALDIYSPKSQAPLDEPSTAYEGFATGTQEQRDTQPLR